MVANACKTGSNTRRTCTIACEMLSIICEICARICKMTPRLDKINSKTLENSPRLGESKM